MILITNTTIFLQFRNLKILADPTLQFEPNCQKLSCKTDTNTTKKP